MENTVVLGLVDETPNHNYTLEKKEEQVLDDSKNRSITKEENTVQGKSLNCKQCEKVFRAESSLKKHIESIHDKIKYDCNRCDYKATRKENINRHIRYFHEGIVDHHCPICNKGFMMGIEVKYHIKRHHEGIKEKCDFCEKEFLSKQVLKNHIQVVHEGKTFDCDLCSYKANSKQVLDNHIKSKHEGVLYECKICDFKGSKLGKWYHMKKHQLDGTWAKVSGKWTKVQTDEYSTHFCDKCDYHAKNKYHLKIHTKYKHEGKERKRVQCPKCDKTYAFYQDMRVHFRAEHEGRRYKCKKCDHETKFENNLRIHIKYVHGNVEHKCNYCEMVFQHKSSFKKHVTIHEGGGFKCDNCNYKTTDRKHLVIHQKVHSTAQFKCKEVGCRTSFSRKSTLTKHMRKEHNVQKLNPKSEDRYPCPLCDFENGTRQGLKTHISVTHQSFIKRIKNEDKEDK